MIGDRLLVEDAHWKKAKIIQSKVQDRGVVLIGACSGAGKSETAECVQHYLFERGKHSLVLSLDDYYFVHPVIRNYNRKKQGIESVGLKEIDWEILIRICQDFQEMKPIHFKRVHKYLDAVEHNTIESDSIYCLIIEGLYANNLRKFNYGDLSVFMEANPAQTLKFRKKRKKENENSKFRQEVVRKEFNVICQLKKYADLVIPYEVKDEN